ncbi:MAG: ammonium transporter, Amt family [Actinomycetota bacterium]|jgi:Amt family ammonium transporter|nr:ammonium transporter, Amt family [Actinomycetota bacterium]
MDTGDTAWMLIATALVLFMTPGLAFFYGGMVRSKNVLGMLMQNIFAMGLLAVLWALVAFSLAFGDFGNGGWIGNLDFVGLKNVGQGVTLGALQLTIPVVLFAAYQMTFAVITPALITGASADRLKFSAYATFIGVWLVVVYAPVAHWVFAGGWLAKMGALDFAGGAVVHINAGAAALALVLVLGKRKNWPNEPMHPHSLPLTVLGTGILWFGWFGFNAGSALAANGVAAQALMNTFLAASAAMLGWLLVERIKGGHATTLGAASGAVAGLVAITPCAGFVGGLSPIVIGAIAGGLCMLACSLKFKFGFDDSLDVIGVHLIGGLAGSILLGVFADTAVNKAGFDGLALGGGTSLLVDQIVASAVTLAFSFTVSFVLAKIIDMAIGLRVTPEDEEEGLDTSLHAETAYALSGRIG